jgi:quinol monooxygenase YgiN
MSVVVNAIFKARDDTYDELVAYMASILPDTVKYDGAELISCYADPEDKAVVVHEVWAEKAHQEAYLGWRAETGVVDRIVSMLREPPVFEDRTHVAF